jgi:hypothetical protein
MTTDDTTETTEQFAAALADHDRRLASLTQSIEAADRVSELVRLIVDAPACAARLSELRKEGRQIAKARLELVSEHARLGDDRKVLERERAELNEFELTLRQREAQAEGELRFYRSRYYTETGGQRYEPLGGGAGGVRDWGPDPLYNRPAPPADDDETVTERVPDTPNDSTLRRSVRRRRVQPEA